MITKIIPYLSTIFSMIDHEEMWVCIIDKNQEIIKTNISWQHRLSTTLIKSSERVVSLQEENMVGVLFKEALLDGTMIFFKPLFDEMDADSITNNYQSLLTIIPYLVQDDVSSLFNALLHLYPSDIALLQDEHHHYTIGLFNDFYRIPSSITVSYDTLRKQHPNKHRNTLLYVHRFLYHHRETTFVSTHPSIIELSLFTTNYHDLLFNESSFGMCLYNYTVKNDTIVDLIYLDYNKTFSNFFNCDNFIGKSIHTLHVKKMAEHWLYLINSSLHTSSEITFDITVHEQLDTYRLKGKIIDDTTLSVTIEQITNNAYLENKLSTLTYSKEWMEMIEANKGSFSITSRFHSPMETLVGIIWGMNAGTWQWNVQTGETIFNARWAEMIGYNINDLLPTTINTWTSFVHPDDLEHSNTLLQRVFSKEDKEYICNCRMKHKNGHYVWISDRGRVISWTEDNKPLWMFGVHIDITSLKQAEENLRLSEENFRIIFDDSTSCILTYDMDTLTIQSANKKAIETYSLKEVEGNYIFNEYFPWLDEKPYTLDDALQWFKKTKEEGPQHFEWKSILKDGSIIWQYMIINTVTIEHKQLFLVNMTNISEIKQAELEKDRMEQHILDVNAQQKELLDLSAKFINASNETFNSITKEAMKALVDIIDADCAYIFYLDVVNQLMVNQYQWSYENSNNSIKQQQYPLEYISEWIDSFQQGNTIIVNNIHQLHNEAMKQNLISRNTQQLIAIPLKSSDNVIGFIGFDFLSKKRLISDEMLVTLKKIAIDFSNTITRIEQQEQLKLSENRFRNLFSTIQSVAVAGYNEERTLVYCNEAARKLYSYSDDDINHLKIEDLIPEDRRSEVKQLYKKIYEDGGSYEAIRAVHHDRNNKPIPVLTTKTVLDLGSIGKEIYSVDIDCTEIDALQFNLQQERELFHKTLLSIGDGVISTDINGNIQLLNYVSEQLTGYSQEEAYGLPFEKVFNIVNETTRQTVESPVQRVLKENRLIELANHTVLISKNGIEYYIEDSASPIRDKNGQLTGVVVVFRDCSEKKERQLEIEFLSSYDYLTGLINRRHLEKIILDLNKEQYMPLTFMYVDVNGLKLTNDAFGHAMGDRLLKKVGQILRKACKPTDYIGRLGGDEFMIVAPNCSSECAHKIKKSIQEECEYNKVDIVSVSLAIGYMVKETIDEDIDTVRTIAENHMYKDKILNGKNMRIQTFETVLRSINLKYDHEQLHSERVSLYSEMIARAMKLDEEEIIDIKTAAILHDIGKIAVEPDLLRKPGRLTQFEFESIKKHSEIGYQILRSVDEYHRFAQIVLYHHERWDGLGYPQGLKGEEIPLASRIICVADAFEAMTASRCYQPSRSVKSSLEELQRCSWSQFDGNIVNIFINALNNNDKKDEE